MVAEASEKFLFVLRCYDVLGGVIIGLESFWKVPEHP